MKEARIKTSNGFKFIGSKSRTLVSGLIGASVEKKLEEQYKKITNVALLPTGQRPDILSDLSLIKFKKNPPYHFIIKNFPDFAVSTLPIYLCTLRNGFVDEKELLEIIQEQAEMGVSMFTIHPTATKSIVAKAQTRMIPCTSRGGGIIVNDLIQRNFSVENAYLRILDEIVKIAVKHEIVISIGASFRSANIFDTLDEAQLEEFKNQKKLGDYIFDKGVNVIIEGPGHCSPKKIGQVSSEYLNMGFPVMPLGPIPTDAAIGQDHISSSIGAVLLGINDCAHILSAVTREEHTGGVPSISSTIEGIIASKIAAHIIDLFKFEDSSEDLTIAAYRSQFDTCVYGKKSGGCSRCLNTCPLENCKIDVNLNN